MSGKIRLSQKILFLRALLLLPLLLLAACGPVEIRIVPADTPTPAAPSTAAPANTPAEVSTDSPCRNLANVVVCKDLVFTAAVKELGTTETGKQDIGLGKLQQPGRYVLQLANDNAPLSNHWIEWDYLSLKAGSSFVWQIGQEETPPVYNSQASDEFCSTAEHTDCRAGFEVIAGRIDERSFPKTLNDGAFPVVRIVFTVVPEQSGSDLALTLSTLYSSHLPDIRDFKMQVILYGPY